MRLFGPVFIFNLIRVTRRGRFFTVRFGFGLSFLLMLFFTPIYSGLALAAQAKDSSAVLFILSQLAERFFLTLIGLQYFTVLLLTPACVATALSEEKQSRQLELLLTTDISVGEIVLGKMLARLGLVFQLVLAGLPVLSLIQLFGGVEPSLIWTAYGVTLLTLFSLGSVSILCSLYSESTPGAVVRSYVAPLLFFVLLWALPEVHGLIKLCGDDARWHGWLDELIALLQTGNPLTVVNELSQYLQTTGSLGNKPWELLGQFAFFHGIVIVGCLSFTVLRLRRTYLRYVAKDQSNAGRQLRQLIPWRRPPLRERPMLWKECYGGAASRLGPLWRVLSVLGALTAIFIGLVVGADVMAGGDRTAALQAMNNYLRIVGPLVLGLALIQIGVSAAGCLHGEKQQLTWDSLVMTLFSLRDILAGKWWGSIHASRYLLGVLGLLLILGMVTEALHPLSAVLMAGTAFLACSFTASLGVFFAVLFRSHFGAVMWTLVVLFILNLGLPYLSPWTWAFLRDGMYYYPAPPSPYERSWRTRHLQRNDNCAFCETGLSLGLKTVSPVNLWQWLALTNKQVHDAEKLNSREEWEEDIARARMAYYGPAIRGRTCVFSPLKTLWHRLRALLFVLPMWFSIDYFLWRRSVRRLMLQLERVDEYPIRYWKWPPGA
jgi:ABC-type transport system involved in multi-copper enzyme maturation permease subunit